jgi:protein-S-isoprenylcysteine O-methyltransferase Ste14
MHARWVLALYVSLGLSGFGLLYLNSWLSPKARRSGARAHWLLGWWVNGLGMFAIVSSWLLLSTLGPRLDWLVLPWVGALSGAAGAMLFVASAENVGRLKRPSRYSLGLDTSGVYSIVRHPQALALSAMAMGLAGITRSVPLLVSLPLWVGAWYLYARLEEKFELLPSFGDAYASYAEDTPAFLPDPRRLAERYHAREESTFNSR